MTTQQLVFLDRMTTGYFSYKNWLIFSNFSLWKEEKLPLLLLTLDLAAIAFCAFVIARLNPHKFTRQAQHFLVSCGNGKHIYDDRFEPAHLADLSSRTEDSISLAVQCNFIPGHYGPVGLVYLFFQKEPLGFDEGNRLDDRHPAHRGLASRDRVGHLERHTLFTILLRRRSITKIERSTRSERSRNTIRDGTQRWQRWTGRHQVMKRAGTSRWREHLSLYCKESVSPEAVSLSSTSSRGQAR